MRCRRKRCYRVPDRSCTPHLLLLSCPRWEDRRHNPLSNPSYHCPPCLNLLLLHHPHPWHRDCPSKDDVRHTNEREQACETAYEIFRLEPQMLYLPLSHPQKEVLHPHRLPSVFLVWRNSGRRDQRGSFAKSPLLYHLNFRGGLFAAIAPLLRLGRTRNWGSGLRIRMFLGQHG